MGSRDTSSPVAAGPIGSALKEMDLSRSSHTSVTLLEEDLWNFDLDDLLDMPETPCIVGLRSSSFTCPGRPTMPSSFKRRSSLPHLKRNVSFSKVEIRVFERILGDNPPACGVRGPSLGLGWNYNEKKPVDLDKFESKRAFRWSTRRRSFDELVLSPEKRERMARKLGYSSEEIEQNIRRIEKVQNQRDRTARDPMTHLL